MTEGEEEGFAINTVFTPSPFQAQEESNNPNNMYDRN
jgi:hypothetical protein